MRQPDLPNGNPQRTLLVPLILAVLTLLVHFCLNSRYGYQRDELYFISCGERLAWGYVDIGPLSMWLGRLSREMLGESLFALRFFPALAGAGAVFMAGLLARRLGGGRYAQFLAALAMMVSPWFLGSANVLCLPAFEPLFWTTGAYLVVRIIQTGQSRLWVALGVVAGIGLLNKPSMLFWVGGLAVGMLLTPHRKYFLDKWLWCGVVAGLIIVSPYLYWQVTHGWPTVQFMRQLNEDIMSRISHIEFVAGQLLYMHPFNLPLSLVGLWFYFFAKNGKPYRLFGWLFLAVFAFLFVVKSKTYYFMPAYPMVFAAGGLVIEGYCIRGNRRILRTALPVVMVVGGLITAPLALPILPLKDFDAYVRFATGGILRNTYEVSNTFRDMMGWENQAAVVARVFHSLPEEDRKQCIVIAGNFGEAGAIDFFGKQYGLPPATSTHQNYFFWGPPEHYDIAVAFGPSREELDPVYADVQHVDTITCEETVEDEQHIPVYVCRNPKVDVRKIWPTFREFAFRN